MREPESLGKPSDHPAGPTLSKKERKRRKSGMIFGRSTWQDSSSLEKRRMYD